MKTLALVALACLPVAALAQTAQTTCYQTAPTAPPSSQSVTCSTYLTPGVQPPSSQQRYVNPHSASDAFARTVELEQQQEALRQQAEVAAAQGRNLELQNEMLRKQLQEPQQPAAPHPKLIEAEAAIFRRAFVDILQEQWKLPEDQRETGDALARRALGEATLTLGHAPSPQALDLASKQLEAALNATQSEKP